VKCIDIVLVAAGLSGCWMHVLLCNCRMTRKSSRSLSSSATGLQV